MTVVGSSIGARVSLWRVRFLLIGMLLLIGDRGIAGNVDFVVANAFSSAASLFPTTNKGKKDETPS